MTRIQTFLLGVLAAVAIAALPGDAQQPVAGQLVFEAPGATADLPALADVAGRAGTRQSRAVIANLAALDADVLEIAVASQRTFRVSLIGRTRHLDGSQSWAGQVVGEPLSAATFVRRGSLLQGSVRTLDAAYSIEPLGTTGLHVVREVDLAALGDELPSPVPDPAIAAAAPASDPPPTAGDDGSTFDVLVVYTPAARDEAGGDAAAQARIALGIAETNQAYASSGVMPRLRLVGAELVNYVESNDLYTDLTRLTTTGDGQMDAVHARRDALGADLVKLVVRENLNACGIAWLMDTLSSSFAANAFSVTSYPCISPNYTFGHELGHNMGSTHAPEDGGSPPLFSYSYGYKNPSHAFRTVMAYQCPIACPRILYFSNPSVAYGGQPTGTAGQHHNARSINEAASTIANWRQAVSVNTAPTISALSNRTTPEDTATSSIAFTVSDAQTAAGSLTVTATSSNPAVVANSPAGLALGGSGGSRTLVVTPQPDAFGSSSITVRVSDGSLTATSTFLLTVTAVNDPPAVSTFAPQTTSEDQALSIPFTISDPETAAASLTVQATSSNQAVVSAGGITVTGSGTSRMLTLTPMAEATGTTTIQLSVSDGVLATGRTFVLTVTPIDDSPVFDALPPLASTTTGLPVVLTVTVTDADSPGSALTLNVSSANGVLLPPSGISVATTATNTAARTFQVTLTPAPGQTGTSALSFTAGDGTSSTAGPVAFNVSTTVEAPHPPTALTAVATGTSVRFAWTPALTGSAPTSFALEMGAATGTSTLPTQTVPWPTTQLTLVLPAGTYYARVRGVNGLGTSAPSPEATVDVVVPSPLPGPPGNFFARVTGRTVTFTWTAATTGEPATGYTLEAGSTPGLSNLAVLATGTSATSLTVSNVPVGTYWVRVRGSNAAGMGAPSQDVAIVMGSASGCAGLPGAPVLLTPVVNGHNVTLSWQAPATGSLATGYVLQAGSVSGASNLASFATGNASTSFAASAPSGLYYVRIAASNSCGAGPVSNEVSFTLGAEAPGAPTDLSFSMAGNLVSLSWSAPATGGSPTAYVVEAGNATGLSNLATVSTGSTATTFSATAPPGLYYVRVRAVNSGGVGPSSPEVVITVP